MSTIDRRINERKQFRERQEHRRTGPKSFFKEAAEMLQGIDGQADLGALPGESLMDVMTRRMMHLDGWNLNALPGSTENERWHSADLAANGKLAVSDEIRHAARHCLKLYEGI
jgi:hypothetical protein